MPFPKAVCLLQLSDPYPPNIRKTFALFGLLAAFLLPVVTRASSWDPTLVVNTEAFQIINDGDGATDLVVQFGDSLGETLKFDLARSRFSFSDDLHIDNDLTASGSLSVEGGATVDGTTFNVDSSTDSVSLGAGGNFAGITTLTVRVPNSKNGEVIKATGTSPNSYLQVLDNTNAPHLVVTSGGSTGLGTSAPETKLEVVGTASGLNLYASNIIQTPGTVYTENLVANQTATLGNGWYGTTGIYVDDRYANAIYMGDINCNTSCAYAAITPGSSSYQFFSQGFNLFDLDGDGAGAVFNSGGADYLDFRVASSGNQNQLFVDALTSRVGIGTNAPETDLEVIGTASGLILHASNLLTSSGGALVGNGSVSAPSYSYGGDSDTGLYHIGANTLGFATNGTERARMNTTEAVINDTSNNYDFRVESDNNTAMLYVSGARNRVGVGTNTVADALTVSNGSVTNSGITIANGAAGGGIGGSLTIQSGGYGNWNSRIQVSNNNALGNVDGTMKFMQPVANSDLQTVMALQGNKAGIGTATPETSLEVLGTASGTALQASNFLGSSGVTIFNARRPGNNTQVEALSIASASGVVINEDGNNMDFRAEGHSDEHLVFFDASTDRVGIGTNAPKTKLEVNGTASGLILHAANFLTASGAIRVRAGTSTGSVRVGGMLPRLPNVTAVTATANGENNLITYSLPKNIMTTDGDTLIFEGSWAGGALESIWKIYFGGTELISVILGDGNAPFRVVCVRLTSSTANCNSVAGMSYAYDLSRNITNSITVTGLNFANSISFKTTGTSNGSETISQTYLLGMFYPANP